MFEIVKTCMVTHEYTSLSCLSEKTQTHFDRDNVAAHLWSYEDGPMFKQYVVRMGDGKGNMQAQCCHGNGQRGERTQYLHQSEV